MTHTPGTHLYILPCPRLPRRHEAQIGTVQRITRLWAAGERMLVYWLLFAGDAVPWPYSEYEVEKL